MICIGGQDRNLVPRSRDQGYYFTYHVVDDIDDTHLTVVYGYQTSSQISQTQILAPTNHNL